MQDCFRQHPEMYGSELEDDDEEVEEELRAREAAPAGDAPPQPTADPVPEVAKEAAPGPAKPAQKAPAEDPHRDSTATTAQNAQKSGDEGGELVPKAAHDATSK
jgi:intermembrane space import and assembly protein 40